MLRSQVFSQETPETRCACVLFVNSGQVVFNPGVDRGVNFSCMPKRFSSLNFRGVRASKSSSELERKKKCLKFIKLTSKVTLFLD